MELALQSLLMVCRLCSSNTVSAVCAKGLVEWERGRPCGGRSEIGDQLRSWRNPQPGCQQLPIAAQLPRLRGASSNAVLRLFSTERPHARTEETLRAALIARLGRSVGRALIGDGSLGDAPRNLLQSMLSLLKTARLVVAFGALGALDISRPITAVSFMVLGVLSRCT